MQSKNVWRMKNHVGEDVFDTQADWTGTSIDGLAAPIDLESTNGLTPIGNCD